MTYIVRWADNLAATASERFGTERSVSGRPSEYDFVGGPLAAATLRFADLETLPEEAGPAVRSVHTFDQVFGPIVFVGVLVDEHTVEIGDFVHDPDYWTTIDEDPDE